jgi:putative FmdB family regulatory protein
VPRYAYRCRTCGALFELPRRFEEPETAVSCPDGHAQTSRVFTAVTVGGGAASATTATDRVT